MREEKLCWDGSMSLFYMDEKIKFYNFIRTKNLHDSNLIHFLIRQIIKLCPVSKPPMVYSK